MKKILLALILASLALLGADLVFRGPGNAFSCRLVMAGYGPLGAAPVYLQRLVTGLVAPWQMVFPAADEILVNERVGRIRLIRGGSLVSTPVARIPVVQVGEQGLLGIALDPQFPANSLIYVYYTFNKNGVPVNRVERYTLSSDHTQTTTAGVILDDLPAQNITNGGALRFGPDGKLYVSVGEALDSSLPENPASPGGKILRINRDGSLPADNPVPGQPWFIRGIRSSEGFDWLDPLTMLVADSGPNGEYQARTGGDRIAPAHAGENLGWPERWQCNTVPGTSRPLLAWVDPLPSAGAIFYRGRAIPEWTGSFLFASPRGQQIHRVALDGTHEVYFLGRAGRLRDIELGPDGVLYVMSSNCDGAGFCPPQGDAIYRVVSG